MFSTTVRRGKSNKFETYKSDKHPLPDKKKKTRKDG